MNHLGGILRLKFGNEPTRDDMAFGDIPHLHRELAAREYRVAGNGGGTTVHSASRQTFKTHTGQHDGESL